MKTERQFWDPLLKLYPPNKYSCCLIDDNTRNIQAFRKLGYTRTLHINRHFRLPEALVYFLNILPTTLFPTSVMSPRDVSLLNKQAFKFDSTRYLHYKNEIDRASFNIHAKKRLIYELNNDYNKHAITQNVEHTYTVVDIGAGIMNMFIEVLDILSRARESNTRPSLDSPSDVASTAIPLVYIAYESNTELNHAIVGKLNTLGLRVVNDTSTATTSHIAYIFKGSKTVNNVMFDITVYVLNIDFTSQEAIDFIKSPPISPHISHTTPPHIDLIVGCCVADLVDPRTLVAQLLEFNKDGGGLLYLPITFTGTTRLHRPREVSSEDGAVASDQRVFELYRQHLLARGHHIGVPKLLETFARSGSLILPPLADSTHSTLVDVGKDRSEVSGGASGDESEEKLDEIESNDVYGKYIAESASNWHISPKLHPYMWSCMMRFIALGVILPSISHNSDPLDLTAWFLSIQEAMQADASSATDKLELIAGNVDLVIRLPLIHQHVAKAIPYKGHNSDSSSATETGVDEYFRAAFVDELVQSLKYQCQADEADEHITEFNRRLIHSSHLANTTPSPQKVSNDDFTASIDQPSVSGTPPIELAPTPTDLTRTYPPNSTIATQMIEFLRPNYAHIITESLTTSTLTPDQLLLESEVSLISTGTELKMYAGDVDTAQPTDLTIGGLKDSTLAYPMKYGSV